MIARDEAAFLAQCLDSVKAVVDEIIVVDTGSVDTTKDIAVRSGAKVFDLEWADDFSAARNYALDQATGDWVLVLDADETISESDHGRLLSLASEGKADAYSLVQRTYGDNLKHAEYVSCGADAYAESQAYAGWIPSRLVRLFRNDPDYHFRYRIHEVVEPSIEKNGGVIRASGIPIHHFTYQKTPDFIDSKLKRYLEYGLKQIEATPQDPKPYLEVAPVYLQNKEFGKAEQILLKGIEASPANADLYDALGTLYLDTGRAGEAERVVRKGLSLRANDVTLLNKLASACLARRAHGEAETLFKRARKLAPDSIMVHNNLGLLFAITNRPLKAIDAFQNTLRLNPANLYALTNLGMLYVNLGRFRKASPVLEQALKVEPADVRALYHLAVTCASLKQKPRAIELLKRAQQIQPGDPAIAERLRELT